MKEERLEGELIKRKAKEDLQKAKQEEFERKVR
jgi:hypothetical protein